MPRSLILDSLTTYPLTYISIYQPNQPGFHECGNLFLQLCVRGVIVRWGLGLGFGFGLGWEMGVLQNGNENENENDDMDEYQYVILPSRGAT